MENKIHETRMRVKYYETDAMAIVHHSNYIRFFETARTEMIRSLGYSYAEMEESGIWIPVLSVSCNYKTPAVYDEEISVFCSIKKLGPASFEIEYEVRNTADGTLHATGTSKHGFTDKNLKPIALKKVRPEIYDLFQKCLICEK
ncbi:MAG: thioesterase family protein [Firmicutes bacterium]|nr:thioesterase family protein [Bacillota bacterium]